MRSIVARNKRCEVAQHAIPEPSANQVLIKVHCTAVNRADTLQRLGKYPPPPGCTEILGLECAGKIAKCGSANSKFQVGDEVAALVSGGAFAEFCVADCGSVLALPTGFGVTKGAAIPEVWLTAYQLLHFIGGIQPDETVLIHAAASGVGTAAIQLAKQAGARNIIATASAPKLDACRALGATHAFDRTTSWDQAILDAGHSVDLVLDCVGQSYAEQNVKVLAQDSRWVLFGLMGGAAPPPNLLAHILRKRISLLGSTLRARSDEYKAQLVGSFISSGRFELLTNGTMKPVLDERAFKGLDSVNDALDYLETNTTVGKVLLHVQD